MVNKYFKNFIFCGEVDYQCLLCKENFLYLSQVDKHIRWETHRKCLTSQTRNYKFKKEAIFTVCDIFYCETCNYIAPDMTTMKSHVGGDMHKENKENPKSETEVPNSVCKRDPSGYVIVSNIIVENRNWHGIVGDQCVICGINEFRIMAHINTYEHVHNLIKAPIFAEDNDKCYRKINDSFFYCFICKNAISSTALESHWLDKTHTEKQYPSIYRATSSSLTNHEDKKKEVANKLIVTQKAYFYMDNEKSVATCKQCKCTMQLDFKIMLNHQKEHKDDTSKPVIVVDSPSSSEEELDEVVYHDVQDHGKRRSELSKYGKDNYIRLNPGGSRGYCGMCHTNLSANLKLFKEHVKGSRHRGHLEVRGIKTAKDHSIPERKCKPLTEYLNDLFYARLDGLILINKETCLDIQSFILVSDVEKDPHFKKTKCFVCDLHYDQGKDLEHCCTEIHKKRFLSSKVLSLKGEFVREIRPDLYHCGFCSQVYPFWELMNKHLKSMNHTFNKHHKKLILRTAYKTFNNKILIKTSDNPDILYIQLINVVFTANLL